MNLANAVRYLANGQCIKTESMLGYIKRDDYDSPAAMRAAFAAASVPVATDSGSATAGDVCLYGSGSGSQLVRFRSGKAASAPVSGSDYEVANAEFALTFVENPHWNDGDGDDDSQYAFLGARFPSGATFWREMSGESDLVLDSRLWSLFLTDQWEAMSVADVVAAQNNTARW